MNTKFIRYNLEEIEEEIENVLSGLKRGDAYAHREFHASMQHIIHHVNIAWNARNATTEEVDQGDLSRWSQFPTDIALI